MRAISIRQPFAERIASGEKTIEYRTWPTHHRGLLLVVASKAPHRSLAREAEGLPLGVAICVVNLVGCEGVPGDWQWHLDRPRRVEPFAVRGSAAFYHVEDSQIVFVDGGSPIELGEVEITSRARPSRSRAYDRYSRSFDRDPFAHRIVGHEPDGTPIYDLPE